MADFLTGDLLNWLSTHTHWLGLAIFLISLTESLAIAGLLVPGVLLLFAASALAGGGDLSLLHMLLWAGAGAICGDVFSFVLGRYFHQDIRRLKIFAKYPHWLERGEGFFRHYGTFSIFLGRFIGPIRPIIPMIAGMFDMPVWRFLLVNILSALAWAPVYVIPGYLAGNAAYWSVPESFWQEALLLAGGVIGLAICMLLILFTQTRWSSLAAAALGFLGLFCIVPTAPWLGVAYGTLDQWLSSTGHEALILWRHWLQPLTSETLLPLLFAPAALLLAFLRQGWKLLFLTLCGLLCLALDLLPNTDATLLALPLSLIWGSVLLCNQTQSFWLRMSWILYCLPVGGMLMAAWLLQSTSVSMVLTGLLQSVVAVLLAIWLAERGGQMSGILRRDSVLLATWPVIACVLLLLGR